MIFWNHSRFFLFVFKQQIHISDVMRHVYISLFKIIANVCKQSFGEWTCLSQIQLYVIKESRLKQCLSYYMSIFMGTILPLLSRRFFVCLFVFVLFNYKVWLSIYDLYSLVTKFWGYCLTCLLLLSLFLPLSLSFSLSLFACMCACVQHGSSPLETAAEVLCF